MKRKMSNSELPSPNKSRYLFVRILTIVLLCEAVVMADGPTNQKSISLILEKTGRKVVIAENR